ncbi:transcriptional repressor [Puniceicoccales bacterium CK1056]|uniref:Transcriptional repressor n=1 Tax=Oceanipulchritudo coccoides TaxID=2706888 RepID=A0A6B2LWV9_9BACT|nr:transcriptional repressor [Oceanipulchritudo coccoides]NDV60921.1 transcriptional repressor [Oceanipulchritudo coccoides]
MLKNLPTEAQEALDKALTDHGLRSTRQREHVFKILLTKRDHPTADEVYARAKKSMTTISLATVYNCLETLVGCGLVRAVNYEREPTRFCPNLSEHAHFQDRKTGRVYDVDLPTDLMDRLKKVLPEGYEADSMELYFHGKANNQSSD